MWHHYRHNKADNIEAQAYFRRALAIDAHYPQAMAASLDRAFQRGYDWLGRQCRCPLRGLLRSRATAPLPSIPAIPTPISRSAWCACGRAVPSAGSQPSRRRSSSTRALPPPMSCSGRCTSTPAGRKRRSSQAEKGIRLSPSDPRLFIWLPALAGAHYQLRHYAEAVEAGRRSWTLNRNWPHGLRYVVAGLAQLGRIDEAQAPWPSSRTPIRGPRLSSKPISCGPTEIGRVSITSSTGCARPASSKQRNQPRPRACRSERATRRLLQEFERPTAGKAPAGRFPYLSPAPLPSIAVNGIGPGCCLSPCSSPMSESVVLPWHCKFPATLLKETSVIAVLLLTWRLPLTLSPQPCSPRSRSGWRCFALADCP